MKHRNRIQSAFTTLLFAISAATLASDVPRLFTSHEESLFRERIQTELGATSIWVVHGSVDTSEKLAIADAEVIVEPSRAGERFCFAPAVVYESNEYETFENADWKLAGPFVRYYAWDAPDNGDCTRLSLDTGFRLEDRIDTDTLGLIVDSGLQIASDGLMLLADTTSWTPPAATAFELKAVQLRQHGRKEGIHYAADYMAGPCIGVSAIFRIIRGEIRIVDAYRVVC